MAPAASRKMTNPCSEAVLYLSFSSWPCVVKEVPSKGHRKQTGKPFAKETSTALSSHQFLLLVYDANETERVRLRRSLSNVPVEARPDL